MESHDLNNLTVIAGPCSVDENNLEEIIEIAKIVVVDKQGKKQKAVAGTRILGLKSRSEISNDSKEMGIDHAVVKKNWEILLRGGRLDDLLIPPSVEMASRIIRETDLLVGTEIVAPVVQLPPFEKKIPKGKLLIWNPAANQLGWPVFQMAQFAKRNNWILGLKNGKWLGESLEQANSLNFNKETTMEKTWQGLAKYAENSGVNPIFIQRGVDVPGKQNFRNAPIHNIAKRVKEKTGCKMFFDPSHSLGPKMRDKIVSETIKAMQMKINDSEFLYDGILIEVGTSKTDTKQHISIEELKNMCNVLASFRDLNI